MSCRRRLAAGAEGRMRWWWWLSAVTLVAVVTLPTAAARRELDSPSLGQVALDLFSPLLGGNMTTVLEGLINTAKIGMGIPNYIDMVFDLVSSFVVGGVNIGSHTSFTDRKMLAMFEGLSQRLDQMEHGVTGIANSLVDLANGMPNMVRWAIAFNTMQEYTRPINALYKRFRLYQKMKDRIEDHTLMNFANTVVSHDTYSIMSLMAHLHSMAAPGVAQRAISALTRDLEEQLLNENGELENLPRRPSLFRMLQDTLNTSDNCQLYQSPQQMIEGLHVVLALTEARGYAMLEFAWLILRMHNEGNFTVEHEVSKSLYLQYSEDIMREAKSVLMEASREYSRCDPRRHLEGETYVRLTELLQGYMENEVDMDKDGACPDSCEYYQHVKAKGCNKPNTQRCGEHRRCSGTIHGCRYHGSYASVCLSRDPYRRYDSISYDDGGHYGSRGQCEGSEMRFDGWYRFPWYICVYCLCLCDDGDSPTTDRFISLVPALSDAVNNMVVTGIKFTKKRRVIHFQIQQGQALPQGQVNSSSLHWVDTEPISITSPAYIEGRHYKKLSYRDRCINLDRLTASGNVVVTGVQFKMLNFHINLMIRVTPINYTTGKLQPDRSYWIPDNNTRAVARRRKQQLLRSPDNPTKFRTPSKIDSEPNTFMKFGPTDRWKDVAQLTVPFFDALEVAPTPSTWLNGVELFHKGQPGSGGFLGLKVMNYDMTPHMEVSIDRP